MPLYHIIILALIQGITEFLPVSSSGHLVLFHHILEGSVANLCWEDNRLIDVAVHVGTLFSVLVYFRQDLLSMAQGALCKNAEGSKLLKHIIIASIPVILAGLVLNILKPDFLCLLEIVAWTTLIFGIVLWVADKYFPDTKKLSDLNTKDAFLIGLAQMLALIPGTSRSGITMTAARFLGFSRVEAAHFSLLLAIVAISGAGFLSVIDLVHADNLELGFDFIIAAVLAFISGWIAISLMMKWLAKASFLPFVLYRIVLGGILLFLIYSGAI